MFSRLLYLRQIIAPQPPHTIQKNERKRYRDTSKSQRNFSEKIGSTDDIQSENPSERYIYEKTFKIVPHNHICVCELLRYGCKFWLLRLLKRRSGTFDDEARVSMGGPWEQKFLFHSSLMQEERMFVTKKINYNNSPDSTLPKNSTKPNGMIHSSLLSPVVFLNVEIKVGCG